MRAFTDARGFVDVWALRADVAKVEALIVASDAEACSPEGDPDEQLSPAQAARRQREGRNCVAAWKRSHARFDSARQHFNRAWGPALRSAIQQGDRVAEVIWRQCGTTSVLDRAALESTCDEVPTRRALAVRRLREIGFEPAFDRSDERPYERAQVQAVVMQRFATGDLGGWEGRVYHGGNAPATVADLEEIRNCMILDTVIMETRRAFTFTNGMDVGADDLAALRLNRRATTPGVLTWQANIIRSGSPYSGRHDWRAGSIKVSLRYDKDRVVLVGGVDDARFLRSVKQVLAAIESNIQRWLADDPRWSVFLLQRLGRHEWVPVGLASSSGRLDAAWRGQWTLQRQFDDLRPVDTQPTRAFVDTQSDRSLLRFEADPASKSSAVQCELRYSGGRSQMPESGSHATSATSTVLGYLPSFTDVLGAYSPGPVEPFAPMDPHKSYRQVLVQCPQGEWLDNRTARFLFLAGDTMVEVMGPVPLVIRHWQRDSAADAPPLLTVVPPPVEPTARAVVSWFDAAAARAESVERRVQQAISGVLKRAVR